MLVTMDITWWDQSCGDVCQMELGLEHSLSVVSSFVHTNMIRT